MEECVYIPDTGSIHIDLIYESLSDKLIGVKSKTDLVQLLTEHPTLRDYFLKRLQFPNDSVFINLLYDRLNDPNIDTLWMETRRVFGDESELKNEFIRAFTNMKYYYPDFKIPRIETVVTGFDTDLFISDSLLIVGLDYFLGPGAKYRPHMYEYLLQQYRKENIVPSFMLMYGIDSRFNKVDEDNHTVLADMIAYGKSYYFARRMLPCTPDSVFIWYTREEIQGARRNQDAIWFRLVQDQVLYSTSHVEKQKFLMERPKTLEVGEKCPGRIGQWIGWEIVKSYMENSDDVTLQKLMMTNDANQIFKESKYKPVKR
jgi:hypothetical protein